MPALWRQSRKAVRRKTKATPRKKVPGMWDIFVKGRMLMLRVTSSSKRRS
jgi:hypothetical protein